MKSLNIVSSHEFKLKRYEVYVVTFQDTDDIFYYDSEEKLLDDIELNVKLNGIPEFVGVFKDRKATFMNYSKTYDIQI